MANKATTTHQFKPGTSYKVILKRPVEWRPGIWLRPGEDLTLDGAVCIKIADSILTAAEV